MKLYPKRLDSINELQQEKHRLQAERKGIDSEGLFSFGAGGKTGAKGNAAANAAQEASPTEGVVGILGSLLAGGPMFELGMKLGAPLLRKLGESVGGAGKKAGKNVFRWVTKEVLLGYVKWKAIELSYDGIKHVIESHKKKKNAAK